MLISNISAAWWWNPLGRIPSVLSSFQAEVEWCRAGAELRQAAGEWGHLAHRHSIMLHSSTRTHRGSFGCHIYSPGSTWFTLDISMTLLLLPHHPLKFAVPSTTQSTNRTIIIPGSCSLSKSWDLVLCPEWTTYTMPLYSGAGRLNPFFFWILYSGVSSSILGETPFWNYYFTYGLVE